jgi:hypothetical protein
MTRHGFGCLCAQCRGRVADTAAEACRVQAHNRNAVRAAYASGPRVTLPPASKAMDMYYRWDWMCAPKPGEIEYLNCELRHRP